MRVIRTAIIGTGWVGRQNGRALARNPRSRVVALCDLVKRQMEGLAVDLPQSVECYTDYKEVCREAEVDAVFVGTPNQSHVPIALEAIKHGKHVLVTKPLADSEASARELVAAAEEAGVVNMMSLSARFSGPVRYLGQLTQKGKLGELYYARARSVRRSGIPDWNIDFVRRGGGAFRDMGVHMLDAAWWLMGTPKPVSVTGVAGARFGPRGDGYWHFTRPPENYFGEYASDDYAGGFIRFENGVALQVESFWASHQPDEVQIDLFGTWGGAQVEPFRTQGSALTLYRTVSNTAQDISVEVSMGADVWDRIADHFIECILDNKVCEAPLRHGLMVQEMMERLLRSAESNEEVRF